MSRSNYSGRWRFSAADSTLQIVESDAVVFTIDHREPSFRLARTMTLGGRTDTFELELTVGADAEPVRRGDATLHSSLQWDGDQLVFFTRIVGDDQESTNLVRYRLEEDGTLLIAEERFRGQEQSYDNRWVFEKERGSPE